MVAFVGGRCRGDGEQPSVTRRGGRSEWRSGICGVAVRQPTQPDKYAYRSVPKFLESVSSWLLRFAVRCSSNQVSQNAGMAAAATSAK